MEVTKILSSRLGQKILAFFLVHPKEKFYLRELAGFLKEDPGNLSKIVQAGLNTGLFLEEIKGREKFIWLNIDHPLFPEIEGFLRKTVGFQALLSKELKKIRGLKKAYIYGSFAKKKLSSASDIDLVLVGDLDENELLTRIKKIEGEFNREINYILLTEGELKKRLQQDSFIKKVFFEPKIDLLK
jgi:predicted nucleotidyltransferase